MSQVWNNGYSYRSSYAIFFNHRSLWWIQEHLCLSGNVFNFGCKCKVPSSPPIFQIIALCLVKYNKMPKPTQYLNWEQCFGNWIVCWCEGKWWGGRELLVWGWQKGWTVWVTEWVLSAECGTDTFTEILCCFVNTRECRKSINWATLSVILHFQQTDSLCCLWGWAEQLQTLWKEYQKEEMRLTELQNKYREAKKDRWLVQTVGRWRRTAHTARVGMDCGWFVEHVTGSAR
jgi:hypothetical protein